MRHYTSSQCARIHPKELGSSLGALYSPSGFLECAQNVFPLHFGKTFCVFRLDVGHFLLERAIQRGLDWLGKPELGTIAQDDPPFNDMHQLPHIPRPGIIFKDLHRVGTDLFDHFPMTFTESFGIKFYEERDILPPLPERGDGYRKDIEPVEKVFSELAFFDLFLKMAIGGRYDPNVHFHCSGTAQALKLSALNDFEQLSLQVERKLPNFIQKNRTAVGEFKAADLSRRRTRKSALFPPEELTFDESRGFTVMKITTRQEDPSKKPGYPAGPKGWDREPLKDDTRVPPKGGLRRFPGHSPSVPEI